MFLTYQNIEGKAMDRLEQVIPSSQKTNIPFPDIRIFMDEEMEGIAMYLLTQVFPSFLYTYTHVLPLP